MLSKLHQAVTNGDFERVREHLAAHPEDVNARDKEGLTSLMHAALSPKADIALMRLLTDAGADLRYEVCEHYCLNGNVMMFALRAGDPQKVEFLLSCGAEIHYVRKEGYNALIDAVHTRNPRLIELLRLLIDKGVELNGTTSYNETALRGSRKLGASMQ